MIEAYAFLAAFAVQILAGSVFNPSRFVRYVRAWAANFASERYRQQFPDFDYGKWAERFALRFGAANVVIALLGLVLLGWLYTLIQNPDWVNEVIRLALFYFFLQMAPLILFTLYSLVRHRKALIQLLQPSQEQKRTATLERRGLLDFVSPFAVLAAVVSYFLFVAIAVWLDLYVWDNTSLSRQCLIAVGCVTACYVLNGFIIYKYLYGRKNPYVTHEGRVHTIARTVKSAVYSSIGVAWFAGLMGTLGQPGLRAWSPFALSTFLAISLLLSFIGLSSPPRKPEANGLDAGQQSC